MNSNLVEKYWQDYLDVFAEKQKVTDLQYEAWSFGNSPEMADRLGELVRQGIKTATSSLAWIYDVEDIPLPKKGEIGIILDGRGDPLCIIETTEVETRPFIEVGEVHAYEEGEGDPIWSSERHRPQNKQLWATMAGKQAALEHLARQVD